MQPISYRKFYGAAEIFLSAEVKREAGEIPARTRHCKYGVLLSSSILYLYNAMTTGMLILGRQISV